MYQIYESTTVIVEPKPSNMVVVPKKDGSIRLSLDARAVNTSIKRQSHPIPTLESTIDHFHGAKYFSKIELRQAYCQI